MRKIATFLVLIVSVFVLANETGATTKDGLYTVDHKLVFSVNVKAGDVLEIDYQPASTYATGVLTITADNGTVLFATPKSGDNKNMRVVSYTFTADFKGFILLTAGDKSINNKIYEVRINSEMVFDGVNFLQPYRAIDSRFVRVSNIEFNTVKLNFNSEYLPEGAEIESVLVYSDSINHLQSDSVSSYTVKDLVANTKYEYVVKIKFKDGATSKDIIVNFTTKEMSLKDFASVGDVTDSTATINLNYSSLAVLPARFNLYDADGKLINNVGSSEKSFKLSSLTDDTEYTYYVEVKFDEKNVSERKKITFKTVKAQKEVKNLKAKVSAVSVDLSWELPSYNALEAARIYRKDEEQESNKVASLFSMFSLFSDEPDNYKPLFETNGTTFKDLTVEPDSSYFYKVTTIDTQKNETDGNEINVKTPVLSVVGGGVKETDKGYKVDWTSPTEGKLMVIIGGKDYKVVNASDLNIIIPKSDIKLNIFGNPDVQLVPVKDDGTIIGAPSKVTDGSGGGGWGVDLEDSGLTASNLLKYGVALLGVVGAFVLLRLAFKLFPQLVNLIRNSMSTRQKKEGIGGRRT